MPSATLAFLAGLLFLLFFTHLPAGYWGYILLGIAGCILFYFREKKFFLLRLLAIFILGFSWGLLRADHTLQRVVPADLENKSVVLIGKIISVPQMTNGKSNFIFQIKQINSKKIAALNARLTWYLAPTELKNGDKWQLTARLKKPRGFWDSGAWDYQAWLFAQNIHATGTVVENANNHKYGNANFYNNFDRLRSAIADGIDRCLQGKPLVGLITALAVGIRTQITEPQWAILRATGTNHLFAIAGLHIGFISGMAYFLMNFLWRRSCYLPLYWPAQQAAALVALMVAIIYSALAGFALPTQRAVLMFAIFLFAKLFYKNFSAWRILCLALLVFLILDPFAIFLSSFWLSFGAVALIIYGMNGRVQSGNKIWHWGRIQGLLTLGLIPFTLWFFQQASPLGIGVNLVAIPWVGFLVLPLSLLGGLSYLILPTLGRLLLQSAEYLLELLWWFLNHAAHIQGAQLQTSIINPVILICTLVAVILLLMPRGMPARWLGFIWFLPLLFWMPEGPKVDEVWITLLDVGQGLSAVVRTQQHVLLYDTGAPFKQNFSAADAVILPFLQTSGISTVDTLIVSEEDADEIGGANSLLSHIFVRQVITRVPFRFKPGLATACNAGTSWQWEGVDFKLLDFCVLRIRVGSQTILLTGNLHLDEETNLVKAFSKELLSQILIAPHAGVKNSSSADFIAAVKPMAVLFSVGENNRYELPHITVVQRYKDQGSQIYTTAREGMITFKLNGKGKIGAPETYQKNDKKFWDDQ